ncbi:hypothetical protein EBZ80_07090 [bacterium]|nr:hypothetical protein [bacterium]
MATTLFSTTPDGQTPTLSVSTPNLPSAIKQTTDALAMQRNIAIGAAIILSGFLIYFFAKTRR